MQGFGKNQLGNVKPKLPGRPYVGVVWLVVSAGTHQLHREVSITKVVVGVAGRIVAVLVVLSTVARTLHGAILV